MTRTLLAVVSLWACALSAQTMPSPQEMDRRMRELRQAVPSILDEAARRTPPAPQRPALPQREEPAAAQDPAELVTRFEAAAASAGGRPEYPMVVLVSMSMPREALLRLARDTALLGVPMVFRGLPHGFGGGNTARSLRELEPLVAAGASVIIHPELFHAHAVRLVPAFVVSASARDGCEASAECSAASARLLGDVSLEYALEQLAAGAGPPASVARDLLARFRGTR